MHTFYVRTEVNGATTPPFSLATLPSPEHAITKELCKRHPGVFPGRVLRRHSYRIRKHSVKLYATPRSEVEAMIAARV